MASHKLEALRLKILKNHTASVYSVAISEESGIIVSGSFDNTIKIWDIKTGEEIFTIYLFNQNEWIVLEKDKVKTRSGFENKHICYGVGLVNFPYQAVNQIN